jgi:hypothetical protein
MRALYGTCFLRPCVLHKRRHSLAPGAQPGPSSVPFQTARSQGQTHGWLVFCCRCRCCYCSAPWQQQPRQGCRWVLGLGGKDTHANAGDEPWCWHSCSSWRKPDVDQNQESVGSSAFLFSKESRAHQTGHVDFLFLFH